jgi:hypothetical protein
MLVKCMYCDAENDALATGGFCESCGKKLPASAMVRPRRSIIGGMAVGEEEPAPVTRQRSAVVEGLLVAAVIHLVAGGLFLILGPMLFRQVPERFGPYVLSWTVFPTLAIGGLAWLARYNPQPAALAALVLAALWTGATFLINPQLATGWLVVDVAVLVFLLPPAWSSLRPVGRGPAST